MMCGATFTAQGQTWDISATSADHVTATLSDDGKTLTISGTGAMRDYLVAATDISFHPPWFSVRGGITFLIIEQGVTTIGNEAFYNCSGLTSVTLPNLVTTIGSKAFYQCIGLTSITIPSSVSSIADYAFQYCSGLTSVTIPNSVTLIGKSTFGYCTGLTSAAILNSITNNSTFEYCGGLTSVTIGSSVTSIGDLTFSRCSNLKSLTIPNSVTSIGVDVFDNCSSLTTINVDAGNPNYSSDNGVLFDKNKTTLICYPAGKNGAYVIPSSVSSIADYAFRFSGLTSLTIPNSVISIGDWSFGACTGLTSVTIPNSVTQIGAEAFDYCSGLTSLSISASVSSIGDYAFDYCSGLTSITCLNDDPENVTLGNGVFLGVHNNTCALNVPIGSVSAYQAALQWKDFTHIIGNATGIINADIRTLKIFPNPTKDELCISTESLINRVEIYNADGKMQMQENNFTGKMNVSSLAKGLYIVKVYTVQGVETVKIIKN